MRESTYVAGAWIRGIKNANRPVEDVSSLKHLRPSSKAFRDMKHIGTTSDDTSEVIPCENLL
jgi:hypothetical protein